jgi:two-component system, OmpR family, phosphate regulon response regulator PhoB
MPRVLLVEDDRSLGKTLAERLDKDGLEVEWVQTLASARLAVDRGGWDLAVVDVMLPDGSGFDLVPDIRRRAPTPIMFMTALNSAESRLTGFELGADEYLPKPFHLKEFLLRVRHVLTTQAPRRVLEAGGAVIDWDAMTVERPGGARTFLQVRDYQVFRMLVDAAPRAVSRSDILDQVWGEHEFPTQRTVDNAIVRLRQALGDEDGQLIRTVRGIGYQWAATSK